jgi:site-specific recombinase XerD
MSTDAVTPLRHRMIEDMKARKLCSGTQRGHIHSCKRFAAFLNRSPDTATTEDIRRFQLHLTEAGASICNRNRIMTGLRFLFRVTLRRLDLAAEIYHIREPQKIPLVMSPDETRRLLAVASNLKVRTLLSLGYGCGLRASEVVRLKVKHIDSAQKIIRVEQSKGRKDRNVMLHLARQQSPGALSSEALRGGDRGRVVRSPHPASRVRLPCPGRELCTTRA